MKRFNYIRQSLIRIVLILKLSLYLTLTLTAQTKDSLHQTNAADSVIQMSENAAQQNQSTIVDSTNVSKEEQIPSLSDVVSYHKIFWSILILVFTYLIIKLIVSIIDNFAERASDYRLFLKRLIPIVRISIWIMSIYFVIEGIINPPVETLLAMLASIGLAVGFASQDILKNFFGGFMIILDRPFQVGDKIQMGSDYGEVLQIGLRSTRIVTPDDSIITIPNGELMNKAVSNSNSGALDCQVVSELYVSSEADLMKAKRLAYLAAATSRFVFMQKPIAVASKSEIVRGQLFIKLRIKAYVLDIRHEFPFQTDMTDRTIAAWKANGIQGYQSNFISE